MFGPWEHAPELVAPLLRESITVSHATNRESLAWLCDNERPALVLAALESAEAVDEVALVCRDSGRSWLACVLSSPKEGELTERCYEAGALACFPGAGAVAPILRLVRLLVQREPERSEDRGEASGAQEKQYRRGERLEPPENTVLEVTEGVIALNAVHHDGAAVLLGLFGPGQVLVDHPNDSCALELSAHTDVRVLLSAWPTLRDEQLLGERLRRRVRYSEAWGAMQAHPHLDERLLGILGLLAEQFGRIEEQGVVIDVRVTHTQLASAIGSARTSVTRLLQGLRRRGLIATMGEPGNERFCLLRWEGHHHP